MVSRFLRSPRALFYWSSSCRSHRGPQTVPRYFSSQDYPTIIDIDPTNFEDVRVNFVREGERAIIFSFSLCALCQVVMVKSFGTPTVLNCYANWCNPCKEFMPRLAKKVSA